MKSQVLVTIFGDVGNYAVVQLPERRTPGVVFQLDSLDGLLADVKEAIALLDAGQGISARDELNALYENLSAILANANSAQRT